MVTWYLRLGRGPPSLGTAGGTALRPHLLSSPDSQHLLGIPDILQPGQQQPWIFPSLHCQDLRIHKVPEGDTEKCYSSSSQTGRKQCELPESSAEILSPGVLHAHTQSLVSVYTYTHTHTV